MSAASTRTEPVESGNDLEFVSGLVAAGSLRPIVSNTYPLEKGREAHAQSETGHIRGKLVLRISHGGSDR